MAQWLDDFVFPEGWQDLRGSSVGDRDVRDAMQREFEQELHALHELAGRVRRVVARALACDDIVVSLDRDEAAIVHLSWPAEYPEKPPWPTTEIVRSSADLDAAILSRE